MVLFGVAVVGGVGHVCGLMARFWAAGARPNGFNKPKITRSASW